MKRLAVALLLVIGLSPAVSFGQTSDNSRFLIIRGHGIGPVRLGMTLQDVAQIFGPAAADPPAAVYVWHPPSPPGGPLIATVNERGKIVEVKTYWNVFYETPDGLHIGLAEDDIRAALGAPRVVHRWSHFRVLRYAGITFTIDAGSTIVTGIGVVPETR